MNNIKKYRKQKGITQRDLSLSSGIGQGYISELESGEVKNPGVKTLVALVKGLKVKAEDLYPELCVDG